MTRFIDKHSQFFALLTIAILAIGLISAAVGGFFFLDAAPGAGMRIAGVADIFIACTAPLFALTGVGIGACLLKDTLGR